MFSHLRVGDIVVLNYMREYKFATVESITEKQFTLKNLVAKFRLKDGKRIGRSLWSDWQIDGTPGAFLRAEKHQISKKIMIGYQFSREEIERGQKDFAEAERILRELGDWETKV